MDVLWVWKLYIDSAPWENPPRRRRLTLRLSKEIFSPFYLLLNLWTWNFIYSAPWTSHLRRRPTLRLAEDFSPSFYLLFTLWMYILHWPFTLGKSPVKKTETVWNLFHSVLFITYFMEVKLYWQYTLSESLVRLTHPETGWKRVVSFYLLLTL